MIDTLRALTVAANSLRFNPRIGIDTGEQYERVLTDLRDKLGREVKNDPLTLDELREMDGEPVWITPGGFWALVIARPGERVKLISNDGEVVFADKEIELAGPVYRRKPEKGERE